MCELAHCLSFLFFLIYIAVEHGATKEGWRLAGANRWIQTYMEGLPGCVIVFLLCALFFIHVCLWYLSVVVLTLVSPHICSHTHKKKRSTAFLKVHITSVCVRALSALV